MKLTTEKYREIEQKYKQALDKIGAKYVSIDPHDIESAKGTSIWQSYERYEKGKGPYGPFLSKCFANELNNLLTIKKAQKRDVYTTSFDEEHLCKINYRADGFGRKGGNSVDDDGTFKSNRLKKNYIPYYEKFRAVDTKDRIDALSLHLLSPTERKLIKYYLKGFQLKEIAQKLGKKYKTEHSATESMSRILRSACSKLKVAHERDLNG